MTKQPNHRRALTKVERGLLSASLRVAAEKFKAEALLAPARSLTDSYMRQSIEIERLTAIIAEADFIVLETK